MQRQVHKRYRLWSKVYMSPIFLLMQRESGRNMIEEKVLGTRFWPKLRDATLSMDFSTTDMDDSMRGTSWDDFWMVAIPPRRCLEMWDFYFLTMRVDQDTVGVLYDSTPAWGIPCTPLVVASYIVMGHMIFPSLSWLGVLGGYCQIWLGKQLHFQTTLTIKWVQSRALCWAIHRLLLWHRHRISHSIARNLG